MTPLHQHTLSRRRFCLCCSAAATFAATGGWLSPSHIELCGATAKVHNWGNADLLPDVKVNTDAMARTTQLVPEGFVKITE